VTPDSGAPDTVGLLAGRGDIGRAAAAHQLAIDSGNREEAPNAALFLGLLRAGQGDPVEAAAAYQLAIDSGHADAAPMAARKLGVLGTAGRPDRRGQGATMNAPGAHTGQG
jgi:hypothetical protein